jgi:Kef-type K+ transport system membrane component KefB
MVVVVGCIVGRVLLLRIKGEQEVVVVVGIIIIITTIKISTRILLDMHMLKDGLRRLMLLLLLLPLQYRSCIN